MGKKRKKDTDILVKLNLYEEQYPDETWVLRDLIAKDYLSYFLYSVINDILSNRYSFVESTKEEVTEALADNIKNLYELVLQLNSKENQSQEMLNLHTDLFEKIISKIDVGMRATIVSPSKKTVTAVSSPPPSPPVAELLKDVEIKPNSNEQMIKIDDSSWDMFILDDDD